jgi:hypothetical protein
MLQLPLLDYLHAGSESRWSAQKVLSVGWTSAAILCITPWLRGAVPQGTRMNENPKCVALFSSDDVRPWFRLVLFLRKISTNMAIPLLMAASLLRKAGFVAGMECWGQQTPAISFQNGAFMAASHLQKRTLWKLVRGKFSTSHSVNAPWLLSSAHYSYPSSVGFKSGAARAGRREGGKPYSMKQHIWNLEFGSLI